MEQSDASYMPSVVAVLAGNTIGGLKELKQTSIPSGQREFVLISGLTQVGADVTAWCVCTCVSVVLCSIINRVEFHCVFLSSFNLAAAHDVLLHALIIAHSFT